MAEQFGIRLSVSPQDLLKSVKEAIDKINDEGKLGKGLNLPVNTYVLASNIKKSIQEINGSNKLDSSPININASAAKLRESIKTAVSQINSGGKLNGTTVKLNASIDLKSTARNLQQQIAELTKQSNNVNIGTTNGNQLQTSIANVRKELEAEGKRLEENNEFLRERVTLFTQSGNVATSRKYGSAGENTIINTNNGKVTSITSVTDNSKIGAEQIKATAAINKTRNALAALKAEYNDANAIKPIKNTTNFAELEKEYNKIVELINEFEKADNKNTSQFKMNVESKISSFEQLIERFQRAEYAPNTLRAKDVTTSTAIESNRLDEFIAKIKASNVPIKAMQSTIDSLQLSLKNIKDAGSLTQFLNEFSIAKSEFSSLKAEGKAMANELSQVDAVTKQITQSLKTLADHSNRGIFLKHSNREDVTALQNSLANLTNNYTILQDYLKQDPSAENIARIKAELTDLQKKLQAAVTESNNLKNSLTNLKVSSDITKKSNTLFGQIADYQRLNSKAMGVTNPLTGVTFGAELAQIQSAIPNAQDLATLDQLNSKFQTIRTTIKTIGKEEISLIDDLKTKLSKFIKWTAMTMLVTKARMYFRQLFTTVQSLDSALIDLRKTFKGSAEELNDFYFEANKLAKQMGVTTEEIIKQGAAFSRLGFSSNETMKQMAEMSAMFAAISPDMGIEDAQNGLVSIMKAFDIDPENVLDGILSKINIIGNTAATSNGEIVEMLKRSSAAMREANNTLEETIALELASIEVTRNAPGTGVAWRTISSRLRGLDEETLEVIEDVEVLTGKIADATKTAKNPGGISIFTDASRTTYKSTYQIIKEIAEIWDDLTDKQTAELGEIMGGKRQLQTISAAVENFKAAEQALENMRKSAGSAEAEMEVIRDSATYAMNELKETFTSLAQHSVSRGGLKNLIKFGTSALEVVDKIVSKIGLIPTILTTIIGITASKKFVNGGIFGLAHNEKTGKTGLTAFGTQVGEGWWGNVTGKTQRLEIENNIKAVQNFHSALKNGNMTMQTYNAVMKNSNAEIKRYGRAALKASDDTSTYRSTVKNLNTQLKQTGTNGKLAAIGTKAAALGVQMLNTAVSMGISLLVSFALNKLIEGVSNAVNHTKILNERVKELNSEFESITSEISSLNKELADTQEKITELEKLPKLSFLQKEELEQLKKYNDELERQRKEKEAEEYANRAEARQKAYEGYKKDTKDPRDWVTKIGDGWNWFWHRSYTPDTTTNIQRQTEALEGYKKALEELDRIKTEGGSKEDEDLFKWFIDEATGEINDYYAIWQERYKALYDSDLETHRQAAEEYKKLIDEWDRITQKTPTTFGGVLEKYGTVKQKLIELAKQGKLTAESFMELTELDVSGIDDFRKALENVEDLTVEDVIESIVIEAEKSDETFKGAAKSVEKYADALESLKNIINALISKQEKLADAFKKTRLNGALSAEEVLDLIEEMPSLAEYVKKVNGGYSISKEGFSNVNRENRKEMIEDITKKMQENREQAELVKRRNELEKLKYEILDQNPYGTSLEEDLKAVNSELDEIYKKIANNGGIDSIYELDKAYDGLITTLNLINDTYSQQELELEGIEEAYNNAKSSIEEYNKQISTVDSAIKKLKNSELLTYDEMVALVEISPELQNSFKKQANGYDIAIWKLEQLRETSYFTRGSLIADMKAAAEYEIRVLQGQNTESAIKRIKALEDYIARLTALNKEITYGDEDNDLSKELQNQVDYWKNILSAVEAVQDKYTEAIDAEIDALEESKDALKENNDERQRELDLIEARNNLENAKKRKVWVYSDDGGFRQTTDQKAVREAEEDYRDAITDIQIAEIDKQIDIREKQKEALERQNKDLTELEENIEKAKIIDQAMKALGLTDEKELLNLPDSMKEEIIKKLTEATLAKEKEENKDNSQYVPASLDDVLKSLGASVTANDLQSTKDGLTTADVYNAAIKDFVADLKEFSREAVQNVTNNNGTVISPTYNINGVIDPEKISEVVHRDLVELFTQVNNSIK